MIENSRITIVCPAWLKKSIITEASNKGITMTEYIKDTLKFSLSHDTLKKHAENKPELK